MNWRRRKWNEDKRRKEYTEAISKFSKLAFQPSNYDIREQNRSFVENKKLEIFLSLVNLRFIEIWEFWIFEYKRRWKYRYSINLELS
jgi:hypothetical protein